MITVRSALHISNHLWQSILSKIAEGGNHKVDEVLLELLTSFKRITQVYDVNSEKHTKATNVVRVPSNDFPVEKLESEVK
jgi:hypothetical protein